MIILIDGYNLLKQHYGVTVKAAERTHFMHMISQYVQHKKHHVIIVFDGGTSRRPYQEKTKHLSIVYAGAGSSADAYIKAYVHEHKGKEILLVSADRELCASVAQEGIGSINPYDFMPFVYQALESHQEPEKTNNIVLATPQSSQIDELMRWASSLPYTKPDEKIEKKGIIKETDVAKHERHLVRLLKKL